MTTTKKYANIKEVAGYTGIPVKTLYHWAETGFIPSLKLGKKILFNLAEIDSFMERRKRNLESHEEISERKKNEILYNGAKHNQRDLSERKGDDDV